MISIFHIQFKIATFLIFITFQFAFAQQMIKIEPEDENIKAFFIDERETTMQDFEEFIKTTKYETSCEVLEYGGVYGKKGENVKTKNINWRHDPYGNLINQEEYEFLPIARVSLTDAQAYAKWKKKRLPTTEEWLLAANSGKKKQAYIYAGSNKLNKVGWYDKLVRLENQGFFKVMQKKPTDLGIFDLSGNAEEITCLSNECDVILRKGGRYISEQNMSRIAEDYSKNITNINFNSPFLGFRLVKDIK